MTVEEVYEKIGGDYKDIYSRLMNNENIVKEFAVMFLDDPSYADLIEQMEMKNYEEAFRASHTLKGVSRNLAFTELTEASVALTEALREKDIEKAEELLEKVKESYEKAITAIHELVA